ncbi:thiamine pyrophosphate-binding protein [Haloarcula pellucida]|uniref:Acetolactate synthase n=1 Tax=Haloarcula pellucida TaxID=1427151 RepID=A0A830GHC6_9EURY|nr:thiamine pyrophosphate-binding protein [Halomicroarcula pellucida]MBX0347393.1 thiamine pyrophosphate-binding protein [Halomicroarcula pellucida]GGN88437.1 acetolactate synthase [Halomicroarcula pellucida]
MPRLNGSEIIAEYLEREGVEYIVGIPGHGSTLLIDAFNDASVDVVQPRHEQGATHLADGYARASGDPLVVFTSIGPGATNTVTGVATAFVDSIPMVVLTGGPQTHEYGQGILQEIERKHPGDFPSVMEPITKETFQVHAVEHLPRTLRRAFQEAVTGRPAPVHIEIPMDVQAAEADVDIPDPAQSRAQYRPAGDPRAVSEAAELLVNAERPVVVPGGGAMLAEAWDEVQALAEYVQAPVSPTFQGKGIVPEDHDLFVGYAGAWGTTAGNELCSSADVILALGVRFSDLHTSSFDPGVSFEIPPTKLIHVDVDTHEIGKNYPVEVGVQGDAKVVARQIRDEIEERIDPVGTAENEYYEEVQRRWAEWADRIEDRHTEDSVPLSMARVLGALRNVLERDAIVTSGAGHPQDITNPEFPVYEPRSNISAGGFSTMGFSLPASMGAKLAAPDRQVVSIQGDGSFLHCNQELIAAVQEDIDVNVLVLNNHAWLSIRNLQVTQSGWDRVLATEFDEAHDYDAVGMAESMGVEYADRVFEPDDLEPSLSGMVEHDGPALVEAVVQRETTETGGIMTGAWHLPGLGEGYESDERPGDESAEITEDAAGDD